MLIALKLNDDAPDVAKLNRDVYAKQNAKCFGLPLPYGHPLLRQLNANMFEMAENPEASNAVEPNWIFLAMAPHIAPHILEGDSVCIHSLDCCIKLEAQCVERSKERLVVAIDTKVYLGYVCWRMANIKTFGDSATPWDSSVPLN